MSKKTYDKLTVYNESKIRFTKLKPYILIKYGGEDTDVAVFDKLLDIIEESLKEKADRAKNV
jgi:hypothetical protein